MATEQTYSPAFIKHLESTIYEVAILHRLNLTKIAAHYNLKRGQLLGLLAHHQGVNDERQRAHDAVMDEAETVAIDAAVNPRGGVSYQANIFVLRHHRGWQERQTITVQAGGYEPVDEAVLESAGRPRLALVDESGALRQPVEPDQEDQ
jgi:hypothetical protein